MYGTTTFGTRTHGRSKRMRRKLPLRLPWLLAPLGILPSQCPVTRSRLLRCSCDTARQIAELSQRSLS
jgi:hypothetical protein